MTESQTSTEKPGTTMSANLERDHLDDVLAEIFGDRPLTDVERACLDVHFNPLAPAPPASSVDVEERPTFRLSDENIS